MKRGELRKHSEQQVENLNISEIKQQYPPGTVISVRVGNEWKLVTVLDVSITNGKFNADVVESENGILSAEDFDLDDEEEMRDMNPEELADHMEWREQEIQRIKQEYVDNLENKAVQIELNHPPTIAAFGPENPDIDVDSNGNSTYSVEDVSVTTDGSIEYNVRAASGEMFSHVPQELVNSLSRASQMERRVHALESTIQNEVLVNYRADLFERVRHVDALVTEAFAQLPSVEDMPLQSRNQIDAIVGKVKDLQSKSEEAVKDLEAFIDASGLKTKQVDHYAQTPVEVEHAKGAEAKEQKNKNEFVEKLQKSVNDTFELEEKEIDKRQKEALQELISKKEAEYDKKAKKYKEDLEAHKADSKKNKKTSSIGIFNPKSVKLSAEKVSEYTKEKQELKVAVVMRALDRLKRNVEEGAYDYSVDFIADLEDYREDLAQSDSAIDRSLLNDHEFDYEPGTEVFFQKTMEAYEKVAKDWSVPFENLPEKVDSAVEHAETFNYSSLQKITERATELADSFPVSDDEAKALHSQFKVAHQELQTLVRDASADYTKYAQPLFEVQKIDPTITSQAELNQRRQDQYVQYLNTLHRIESSVDAIFVEDKHSAPEAKEDRYSFIDIPERDLREALFSTGDGLSKFREAMKSLYSDAFSGNGMSADSVRQFKNIVSAESPDAAVMKQLSQYGIKDWKVFKDMWDTHMAEHFAESLQVSAHAKVKAKIAEKITWYKKAWALKGEVTTRVVSGAVLVGGIAFTGGSLAAGAGMLAQAFAAMGAGGLGGAMRAKMHEWFFGSEKAQKKAAEKLQKLHKDTEVASKTDVIDDLLGEQFGNMGSDAGANFQVASSKIDMLPQLTAIMSQTIREMSSDLDKKPDSSNVLIGDARGTYERALATLEPKDRTEKTKRDLARVISKLTSKGESMEEALRNIETSFPMEKLNVLFADIAGRNGAGRGFVTGSMLAGAFMVDNVWTRATLGAVGGANIGYKIGKEKGLERKREEARASILNNLSSFKNKYQKYVDGSISLSSESDVFRDEARNSLMNWKKMLHGDATQQEAHAFFVSVNDPENLTAAEQKQLAERNDLLRQIQSVVYDVERTGILLEKESDRKGLDRLVDTLQANEAEAKNVDPKVTALLEKELGKKWNKEAGIGVVVGAALGAATALTVGHGFKALREEIVPTTNVEINVPDLPEHVESETAKVAGYVGGSAPAADASSVQISPELNVDVPPVPEDVVENVDVPPVPEDTIADVDFTDEPTEVVEVAKPATVKSIETESSNVIKKGNGTIHALNRLREGGRYSVLGDIDKTGWSAEQTAAWDKMQADTKAFKAWKMDQLKEMGYKWRGGKLGHPMGVRQGDEMRLVWDEQEEEWDARFMRYEYNEDGTPKLDADGNRIDRFKGRIHDKLVFKQDRVSAKTLSERPEVVAVGKGKANRMLENLNENIAKDQEVKRLELQKAVEERMAKKYNPYTDEKLGDGYARMKGDTVAHGEPTKELQMLRQAPEIIENLVDTKDPLAESDKLQAFTEKYVKDHNPDPLSAKDIEAFKDAWNGEVYRDSEHHMFFEDYFDAPEASTETEIANVSNDSADVVDSAETANAANSDNEGTNVEVPPVPDDDEIAEALAGDSANSDTENFNVEVPPVPVEENNNVHGNGWSAKFETDGGGVVTSMEYTGKTPNLESVENKYLQNMNDWDSIINRDQTLKDQFTELSKLSELSDVRLGLSSDQVVFVDGKIKDLIESISENMKVAPKDVFRPDILEKLGIDYGPVAKAA